MYTINKIIPKQDYVSLLINDERLQISIEAYFKYNLKNIKEIDEDIYKVLKDDEKVFKVYRSCLRKLAIKDYSLKQMKDYLYKQDLKQEDINDIIDKLVNYNLLDDDKYCISRINHLQNNNISYNQIIYKLKQEGISDDIINNNLIYDETIEYNKIQKLVNKYLNKNSNKSLLAKKQYLISTLVNNNYSYNMVKEVIDNLNIESDNELELLSKEYSKIKKKYERKYQDYDLKQRIINSLLQKGFKYDDIKQIMEE